MSSRVFIKGLPPTISDEELRKHFSAAAQITDAKLIPHRRIGYVGYKTPQDAAKAVKYFNRSFIRMSKIGVEIARPISDSTLPPSRKTQRQNLRDARRAEQERQAVATTPAPAPANDASLKRKRTDIDENNPKLQEFLEVMQPASKSRTWTITPGQEDNLAGPPKKVQAIELPENESDEEYEPIPTKSQKGPQAPVSVVSVAAAPSQQAIIVPDELEPAADAANSAEPVGIGATDDDWLRSRTSRLLDLVDPDDPTPMQSSEQTAATLIATSKDIVAVVPDSEPQVEADPTKEISIEEDPADTMDATIEAIKTNGRLFARNLPYTATEQELRDHFAVYGALDEVHLPLDSAGVSKGFVLVQYEDPSAAAEAFHNLDGEPFQGRLLHILPAAAKRENKLDEFAIAKLPLKKQKQIKKKAEASSTTFNWNSLYMNQDAVNSSIADRLGVSKSELLDPTSADAAVKQAIGETSIIQETKSYFANNGVDLNAFKKKERGDTAILVKNFPYGTSLEELRRMFEEFGQVLRVLMPPAGTIAIVEFAQPPQARAAFASLAYRRMNDSVLFLEKAPKTLFVPGSRSDQVIVADPQTSSVDAKLSVAELLERESAKGDVDSTTLFVRNLNFRTNSEQLAELFRPLEGFMSARVNTKTDPKKPGQVLSMGFGFLEFRSKAQAQAALSAMNGYNLDDHKLIIKASHKGLDAAEERRKEDRVKKLAGNRTKIIIKNLPFEASKKDVKTLFGTYGQLRSVRVPKKFDNSTRGFAFADFVTAREAENALEALKDTHLLGRRLVLEFATENIIDAEEEIEKMQKKVGKQVNKVALQKLTGGGRKKFNIEGNEDDEQ
ncbi:MAG: Multiple RNA-binding domain-containing protein 1 [Claussenomyces sp. TS43310]|nr:MAG: Multiple RNA-binding domain-containing protein 1 [Claussenomyces sp. TS43310]